MIMNIRTIKSDIIFVTVSFTFSVELSYIETTVAIESLNKIKKESLGVRST